MADPWYREFLACPDCRRELPPNLHCSCGFSASPAAQPDLRPQHPQARALDVVAGGGGIDLETVSLTRPARTYAGPPAERDSSELFSAAQEWLPSGSRLLDLGCGPRDQAVPAAHLQLAYAGIDFESPRADMLGDGHAIPFRDGTFDGVLAYAVLEHLYNPALALREIMRVLHRGGVFFGAVSQGEPFHNSYFHHTAWGVAVSFRDAGFDLIRLWPSYDTLHSLSVMGRYAKAVRAMIEVVDRIDRALPFLAPRKFFRASPREKHLEELYRAASLCFVALKRP